MDDGAAVFEIAVDADDGPLAVGDRRTGELRNGLLVRAADAVVAVGCSWGTLSEIALARRTGVPLVLVDPWDLPPDVGTVVDDAAAAVTAIEDLQPR